MDRRELVLILLRWVEYFVSASDAEIESRGLQAELPKVQENSKVRQQRDASL